MERLSPLGIYYRTNRFTKGRQTLVFIHGLTGSMTAWNEYFRKFRHDFNILIFDLPGHGRSYRSVRYEDYDIRKLADRTIELIDSLEIKEFILISHSFGTLIANEIVSEKKERVTKCIFLSPAFDVQEIYSKTFRAFVSFCVKTVKAFPLLKRTGIDVCYSPFIGTGDLDPLRVFTDTKNTGLHVYFYCLDHICKSDPKELGPIKRPTLLIHGKKDTLVPFKNSVLWAKKMNAWLVLLENANHNLVINNPEEVSMTIEDFISENIVVRAAQ